MFLPRCVFDEKTPQGSKSLEEIRNAGFRALFQMDFAPLRVRAAWILDSFEYASDAAIQAEWAGTGCTVTKSTTKQVGNFAGSVEIDGTGDRTLTKTHSIDLSLFSTLKVWERCDDASSAIQFFASDGTNISYWDITTNGSADTWQQDSLDPSTPDSNNGTDADLSAITSYGYKGLDASAIYLFDDIQAISGMTVAVETSYPGNFYRPVFVGAQPLEMVAKAAPEISAPSANPRIDILCVDSAGALTWEEGTEAATPVPDWASKPATKMSLAMIYCKTTMAKVVDFEDAAANPNEGYIYGSALPMISNGVANLSDLQDVDITGRVSGMVPTWDSVAGKYEHLYPVEPGVGAFYTGTLANFTTNLSARWHLNDGNDGYPNMFDKFILCIPNGSTDPGDTGGAHTATIAETNLPSHNHSCNSTGAHTHSVTGSINSVGNHTHTTPYGVGAAAGTAGNLVGGGSNVTSSQNGGHGHTFSSGTAASNGAHAHTIGSTGSGTALTITNPYYKVAFMTRKAA